MIPDFSRAKPSTSEPRYSAWSTPMGVTTATVPSTTLVASHVPPSPTSTTPASTGASANAANPIAVSTSNLLSGVSWRGATRATNGAAAGVTPTERSRGGGRVVVVVRPGGAFRWGVGVGAGAGTGSVGEGVA